MNGLRNWWRGEPWRIFGRGRWHYLAIYRNLRRGSPHPMDPFGHTYLSGGEPRGRLASLWGAVAFPHVHDDEDFEPDWTVPPGDTLIETLAERDMTVDDLATGLRHAHVRLSEVRVRQLLTGEAQITDEIALGLQEVFGISAAFWLGLERRYREDLARLHPGMTVDLRLSRDDDRYGLGTLAEENGINPNECEFCGGPLDARHPWRRGRDGAAAHEACLKADPDFAEAG